MEIVHLIFSLHTGGTETMLVDILHHQSKRYNTHLVIVNDEINNEILTTLPLATKVHLIGRKAGSRSILPLLRLNILLKRIGTDILHMHTISAVALFPRWFDGSWKKCVTIHAIGISCTYLKRYNMVFAISSAVQQDLKTRCSNESVVNLNGINFKAISYKKLPLSSNAPLNLVQIGRLRHEEKGQHLLIDALSLLRKKYKIDTIVTFIGNGPSLETLQKQAKKLGLEKFCIFSGQWNRQRIYQQLNEFDILVQPSISEGFGLTVVEGMAAGIPVIASDGDGPAEILENGKYGWLFKNGDSRDLADKLHTVIELIRNNDINPKLQDAYEYGKKKFDITMTADRYLQAYKKLTRTHPQDTKAP